MASQLLQQLQDSEIVAQRDLLLSNIRCIAGLIDSYTKAPGDNSKIIDELKLAKQHTEDARMRLGVAMGRLGGDSPYTRD